MAYSIKDLEQAGRAINAHFERRAEQRGEALARRMLQRTAEGRELWCLLLWPAWFMVFSASGLFRFWAPCSASYGSEADCAR